MLLVSPFYWGAIFLGAAIGSAIRIEQRRRRLAPAPKRAVRGGGQKKRKR